MQNLKLPIIAALLLFVVMRGVQTSSDLCDSKNEFLKQIATQGVTIYPTVNKKRANVCRPEWSRHGTCCEAKSLMDYALGDAEKIRKNMRNVEAEYRHFTTFLESAKDRLNDLKLLTNVRRKKSIPPHILKMMPVIHDSYQRANHLISKILKGKVDFLDLVIFKKANDRCWESMIKIRASTLCSTCSGNSQNYFVGKQALLASETCSTIVSDCAESFSSLIQYLEAVRSIGSLIDLEKETQGILKIKGNSEMLHFDMAAAYVKFYAKQNFNLILISDDLQEELKDPKGDGVLARSICRLTLALNNDPFIEVLDNIVDTGSLRVVFPPDVQKALSAIKEWQVLKNHDTKVKNIVSMKKNKMLREAIKLKDQILSRIVQTDQKARKRAMEKKIKAEEKKEKERLKKERLEKEKKKKEQREKERLEKEKKKKEQREKERLEKEKRKKEQQEAKKALLQLKLHQSKNKNDNAKQPKSQTVSNFKKSTAAPASQNTKPSSKPENRSKKRNSKARNLRSQSSSIRPGPTKTPPPTVRITPKDPVTQKAPYTGAPSVPFDNTSPLESLTVPQPPNVEFLSRIADVMILNPSDSMWSYDGMKGSALHRQNSVIHPMNVSICFP